MNDSEKALLLLWLRYYIAAEIRDKEMLEAISTITPERAECEFAALGGEEELERLLSPIGRSPR